METTLQYNIILENHYYSTNGSAIKYNTRNICADSTAKIIEELGKILFPNEEIEVYVIPAKDGCHQDNFWIKIGKLTNNATFATVSGVLLTAYFAYPLTQSQIQVNQSQIELNNLQKEYLKKELNEINPKNNITDEQYEKIVTNTEIKKNKNKHFEQLRDDSDIKFEKIIAKQDNQITFEKKIERKDFLQYIEVIPKINTIKTIEKIHHLKIIKPVNDEEYKDLMWIVEDINGKEKFGVHMCDKVFYDFHLANVIGLKTLIARVKYTLNEDQDGIISIKNKEIIIVYKYNGNKLNEIPIGEKITSGPFKIGKDMKEKFKIINSKEKIKIIKKSNQLPLFSMK